jgi:predicted nucleotidyltransferase
MNVNIQSAIEQAAQKLKESGAREVYVFGSAAHGILHEGSDIDLAVAGLPPDKFFYAMGEAGDILGRPLDLIDLDKNNAFTRYLKEDGELRRVG